MPTNAPSQKLYDINNASLYRAQPGHAVGMAGCGHSKIARVARVLFVLYVMWLAVLTSLQFLTATKICL